MNDFLPENTYIKFYNLYVFGTYPDFIKNKNIFNVCHVCTTCTHNVLQINKYVVYIKCTTRT